MPKVADPDSKRGPQADVAHGPGPDAGNMTAKTGLLSVVGSAVGRLIGWSDDDGPGADPAAVRELFADLGTRIGPEDGDLEAAIRRFQARAGLEPDGVAGPRTVHALARYAEEARHLRHFDAA
jgi:peptidoglycan hydrolase-like protein with peptidoglycan-binding domain